MMKTIEVSDDEALLIDLLREMAKPKADAVRVVVGVRVVPAAAGTGLDIAVDYELRPDPQLAEMKIGKRKVGDILSLTASGVATVQNWKPGER